MPHPIIPVAAQLTDDITAQLPEELQETIQAAQIKQDTIVQALQESIKKKRDDAVKFRNASGIEQEWIEDEEFYEGIDEANRGEPRMIKPYHPSGVVTTISRGKKAKSTIFMNITRQYVDAAAASVSELGNPTDDRNFVLHPAPDPELEEEKGSVTPNPGNQQETIGQFVEKELAKQVKSALCAQDQIDAWLIDCNWHAAMREVVHDSAKIGTGVMKGPVPQIKKRYRTKKVAGQNGKTSLAMVVEHDTVPASKKLSVWNCYPDPSCGDSFRDGNHFIEKDAVNGRQLREMKELEGYLARQIDKVLEEGPRPGGKTTDDKNKVLRDDTYDVWYYYGELTRDEIKAMGIPDQLDEQDESDAKALVKIEQMEAMPCIVTMANDTVIRASLNPLDSGDFPYDFVIWEKRAGSPWGRGISRIMRPAQRVVNAAIRNLMDNAALSGGIQIAFRKGKVKPMGGGQWQVNTVGFWEITDEEITDIKQAISFIELPSRQQEIMAIIQFGQKMAEDITGMPLLLQGQQGAAPDTVGGMQLLNSNATATRRMVARQIDGDFTEPHIRRYYNWILMYGDDSMKGNVIIDARGSQSLVERDIQQQFAETLLKYSSDIRYKIDPAKAMAQVLKARSTMPIDVQYTDEEYKQVLQQQSQNVPPVVQAAQIRAASAEKIAASNAQSDQQIATIRGQSTVQSTQLRTERDAAYEEVVRDKAAQDNKFKYDQLMVQREIALLQYATQEKLSLNDVKAQLAQTTMKLQTEKELAVAAGAMEQDINRQEHQHQATLATNEDAAALAAQAHEKAMQEKQHAHEINVANLQPEVQVPGRAGNGQALSQMP